MYDQLQRDTDTIVGGKKESSGQWSLTKRRLH